MKPPRARFGLAAGDRRATGKARFAPHAVASIAALLALAACRDSSREPVPAAAPTPPAASAPIVLFLGDSLTAGPGLTEEQTYPAVLERRWRATPHPIQARNGGQSGDTTAGGLRRIEWLLQQRPDAVVLALGANDGLRGVPPDETERNLTRIIEICRARGLPVLLAGMLVPPNLGPDYSREFAAIYPRLAKKFDLPLIPFLLDGVAGRPELNLEDGIHPNAEGHERIADLVAPALEKLLARIPPR